MSTPDTRTLGISETEQDRTLAIWLVAFEAMLNRGDQSDFTTLIHPDGYWRDLLATSWQLRTFHGTSEIKSGLDGLKDKQRPRNFRLRGEAAPGQLGEFGATIEGFFDFETDLATGRGISALQLVVYAFRPKAEVLRALETISQELGHPPSYVTDQMARIDVVRREGHALVQGEWVEGANAVAAAVTGKDGELVGIMVSFGPAHRMPPSVLEALRLSTCQAAARLSAQLVN